MPIATAPPTSQSVETPEQLHSLRSMGCDQYQGFHFSPPLSATDFGALMRRRRDEEDAFDQRAERTHSKLAALGG